MPWIDRPSPSAVSDGRWHRSPKLMPIARGTELDLGRQAGGAPHATPTAQSPFRLSLDHVNWKAAMAKRPARKWSAAVTQRSDALDLEEDIFKSSDPDRIARSLKHSAETSRRRKSSAYRSAISMLTFYMNRAGKNLSGRRRRILERAKISLRKAFHRKEASS